jgi:hypothetical protein
MTGPVMVALLSLSTTNASMGLVEHPLDRAPADQNRVCSSMLDEMCLRHTATEGFDSTIVTFEELVAQ